MANVNRILAIGWNDFLYSVTRLKGLIFVVPFFLFWFWVLDKLRQGAALWLEKPQGISLANWMFNPEQAAMLFKTYPPTLSVFLLMALYTLPEFAMLGSYDQLASDSGRGYFRFLLSRSTRFEVFFGRFLSAFFLVGISLLMVGFAMTWVSLSVDGREAGDVVRHGMYVSFVLVLYAFPYVVLMTLLGSVFRSGRACLFAAFLFVVIVKFAAFLVPLQWPELNFIDFALPNRLSSLLVDADENIELKAILALPVYAAMYGSFAWLAFKRRNL